MHCSVGLRTQSIVSAVASVLVNAKIAAAVIDVAVIRSAMMIEPGAPPGLT